MIVLINIVFVVGQSFLLSFVVGFKSNVLFSVNRLLNMTALWSINQNLIDAWELKDAKARIIFYCNVEIGWQVRIEGCSWVVDMWKIDCFYSLQRLPQPNPFFLWLNFTIISTTKVPQTNVTHSWEFFLKFSFNYNRTQHVEPYYNFVWYYWRIS